MPSSFAQVCRVAALVGLLVGFAAGQCVQASMLWSDPDPRVIHKTPDGTDLLGGAVHRDDTANDALYFKFQVDPLSDLASEPYFAGFQLFEGNEPRLGIGNAPEA